MSNSININNIISNTNITDNKQVLHLSEISEDLLQAIKTYKSGMLEVLSKTDGLDFVLQLGDKNFSINIKNNLSLPIDLGQKIEIPVKFNSVGNIIPDLSTINKPVVNTKPEIIVETKENMASKPNLTPIKLQSFIEQNIKEFSLDTNTKQQIMQIAKDVDVSLAKIGSLPQNEADIKNLQNIIKEIATFPQKIGKLRPQIEQIINNFAGKQLGGEIASKINQLYVIKTPLGDSYFSSDIKIPISEKVTLDINSPIPAFEQKIKIIDAVMKNILPEYKSSSNIEALAKESSVRDFAEVAKNVDNKTMMLITQKLPLQRDNLFENIYNLYKGVVNKDITQWLGRETIQEILSDNINGQKNINELGNMLQNSLKETTSWRIVEMPFYDGTQLSALKIAVKKDKRQKEKQNERKTTRFVVETEFSKLGRFQFDGFSKVQSRSLDLIIRTSEKISDDFCANIINLFKKSLYDLDYSGTIKINCAENFINFNEENIITEGVYI